MTTFRAGAASDVGQIRSNNQDSQLIAEGSSVFAVADGMGGHQGGEVASAIAVETLEAVISEPTVESVVEAVKEANRRIFSRAADSDELRGMGTTLVAIALVDQGSDDEEIAWVNVGDSRVYLLRDGELVQLSQDHSLVEDLRRGGQLSEEEAAVHPQRNILTRALGIDEAVQVDTASVMPFTGDRFLLCSDGLFNEVDRDAIVATLASVEDPGESASELVRLANQGGGRDNITCVVVDVTDDGGRSARAAEAATAAAAARAAADEDPPPDEDVTAATAEVPAAPIDPAAPPLTDADPTPPVGLPAVPAADEEPSAGGDPDAAASFAAPVVADGAPPPDPSEPLDEADGDPTRSRSSDEDLPFGRSTTDLFEDLDHAGGRHWALTALGVLVVLAILLGGVYLAGSWWAGRTYYVTAQDDQVQIFRGQPGGFLIFDPTEEAGPDLATDDLTPSELEQVEADPEFDSLSDATTYINTLAAGADQRADDATTTTTSTTEVPTTTAPPSTPTTTAATTTTGP